MENLALSLTKIILKKLGWFRAVPEQNYRLRIFVESQSLVVDELTACDTGGIC
mgnify:CR=1 FL=1